MTYFEAFLYGVTQGVTEYLPVSSSAHLILLPVFLGTEDPGLSFDVMLHLGTLLSTLAFFWRDWLNLAGTLPVVGAWVSRRRGRRGPAQGIVSWEPVALATVPALLAGAALHGWVSTVFRGTLVIAGALIVGGIVLFVVDYFLPRRRGLEKLTLKDAFWIGVGQCFALVPGISRSGATITTGRLVGLDRAAAARFSFLLAGPVTAAAVIFELRNWSELVSGPVGIGPLLTGMAAAFVSGMLAIGALLQLLKRFGYFAFALYRVLLAFAVLQWAVTQGSS